LPISAIDTIGLAFEHTKRQLTQPFRFWQWTRLAFVGLLAGEASGGGFHFPSNLGTRQPSGSPFPHIDPMMLGGLITVLVVAGFVLFIVMMYISSVMRFILFDSVLSKECHIRQNWSRRQGPGWKYFLWELGFTLVMFAGLVILLGGAAAFAFALGWFQHARDHVLGWILGGILVFLLLMIFIVAAAVIQVLTKDFVVPQMAMEGIGAVEGWRRLWPMIQAEKAGYAGYVAMKILLSIAAAIVLGIASFILILFVVIPVAGVAFAAVIGGKAAGLTWDVFTITAAVVAACVLLAILFYLTALIGVPALVFFPAYSIYFFAARYRPLSLVLYPPTPPAPLPSGGPPEGPPPLMPEMAG
jgi:hypothetical protein